MKKIIAVISGLIVTASVTVFAATGGFIDQDNFADWFKDAVNWSRATDIIYGYPDGSFKPNNYVTRAELAVILQRYDQYKPKIPVGYSFEPTLMAFMDAQEKFADNNSRQRLKNLLILVEMGFHRLKDKPPSPYFDEFSLVDGAENLPKGYFIYSSLNADEGSTTYYVNYKGYGIIEGDIIVDVDEWYGPFRWFVPTHIDN